jgi:hypothetical protein
MQYDILMTSGETHTAGFKEKGVENIRAWLNKHGKFISIGDDLIINLDYVVEIKEVKPEEEE